MCIYKYIYTEYVYKLVYNIYINNVFIYAFKYNVCA